LLDTSGKKDNGYLEIEIEYDLRIVKRTLFSGRTEVLYHRPRFGEFLQARQQGLNDSVADASTHMPVTTAANTNDSGENRTKGKKSKGKK